MPSGKKLECTKTVQKNVRNIYFGQILALAALYVNIFFMFFRSVFSAKNISLLTFYPLIILYNISKILYKKAETREKGKVLLHISAIFYYYISFLPIFLQKFFLCHQPPNFFVKSDIASDILICWGHTASQLLQPTQAPGRFSSGIVAINIGARKPPPVKQCSLYISINSGIFNPLGQWLTQ